MRLLKGKKFSESSKRWLTRQWHDPFVKQAIKAGYRSRAAFKLLQIHEKYNILGAQKIIVDLGAAPGGWSQVAVEKMQHNKKTNGHNGRIFALDLLAMDDVPGVHFVQGDFREIHIQKALLACMESAQGIDIILSDMAPSMMGHAETDHLRAMELLETAFSFAEKFLKPGGSFVAKVLQGRDLQPFLKTLKGSFKKIALFKPEASRKNSVELYVVSQQFQGRA